MKKISLIAGVVLSTLVASVYAQDFAAARRMCENYGFVPNTQPFAQCVQTEVLKAGDNQRNDKQNQACLERAKDIEFRNSMCRLGCSRDHRQWNARSACMNDCDNQRDAVKPICSN